MKPGISSVGIYIPPLYIAYYDLADARGVLRDKFRIGLGNISMSVAPPCDDTVSMAANAAVMALEAGNTDPEEIGLLIVSTETGIDQSKPAATYVHELVNISNRARVYEIKHACYAGTAGIMHAANWLENGKNKGKKALVIMSDIAKYGIKSVGEPTQGAGSVAFVMSSDSDSVIIRTDMDVYYSKNVHDFWRPNNRITPIVDGKYSIDCYLEALEFCVNDIDADVLQISGKGLYEFVDYFVYHLPFTKMAYKAHCKLLSTLNKSLGEEQIATIYDKIYEDKIKPSLKASQHIGNTYTGSVYLALISLLEEKMESLVNNNIGIFSYGSGCAAELFIVQVGDGISKLNRGLKLNEQINRRTRLSISEYEEIYSEHESIEVSDLFDKTTAIDPYTRYIYIGEKNNKREYIKN